MSDTIPWARDGYFEPIGVQYECQGVWTNHN